MNRSRRPFGRVLITGGAGFIGSHLADRLHEDGAEVTVLDDLSTGTLANLQGRLHRDRFHFIYGSVLDLDLVTHLVANADTVFHLAAAVGVRLVIDRPLDAVLTNIHGTENVLRAAAGTATPVLLSSSSEIYGKSLQTPFGEDDDCLLGPPSRLRWSYASAKAVDEVLAYGYHRERHLPVVIARLFNTVGPRQSGRYGMVVPRFINQALRGEPLTVYGDGTQSRVFTYAGDVIDALLRLMATSAARGQAFNVAGNEEVTIDELARRVLERTGSSSSVRHVPFADVYGDGFEETPRRVADTAKLERTIGYRCETPLDAVIDRIVAVERAKLPPNAVTPEEVHEPIAISPAAR